MEVRTDDNENEVSLSLGLIIFFLYIKLIVRSGLISLHKSLFILPFFKRNYYS